MNELTTEVTNNPDHAEIRIAGYLSAESADRLDEAMKQVGHAKKVVHLAPHFRKVFKPY